MRKIKIAGKNIGKGQPVFIIAEAGINHDGRLEQAKELVKRATEVGADAVKFQIFKAEELYSERSEHFELFKSMELSKNEWIEVAEMAQNLGIIFLSSSFDEESTDLLVDLGAPAFKVASGDLTHLPFLRYMAKKNKPIILSTGMSTVSEIDEALNAIYATGNKDVVLLHCISNYPANIENVNLRAINTLEQVFNVPVGFSDHTIGTLIPIVAASLGARVIEKHFTLNKNLHGPDHKLSLDPAEFMQVVKSIRIIERALGDGVKAPCESEMRGRKMTRRSIMAKVYISKGTVITKDMLKIVRPGTGIEPKFVDIVIGRTAEVDIQADEIITWEKI